MYRKRDKRSQEDHPKEIQMKTTLTHDGIKHFVAFGQDFYFGFGGWQMFKSNATQNNNIEGFKFKKDAIAYARKNK